MAEPTIISDDVFEEEAVPDYEPEVDKFIPEPMADPEPIVKAQQEEKQECGFVDWLLSLFGLAKC